MIVGYLDEDTMYPIRTNFWGSKFHKGTVVLNIRILPVYH